jgi:hypothetical protein
MDNLKISNIPIENDIPPEVPGPGLLCLITNKNIPAFTIRIAKPCVTIKSVAAYCTNSRTIVTNNKTISSSQG